MEILTQFFEGIEIGLCSESGYWNATQMCKASDANKRVKDWLRLQGTQEYIDSLAEDLKVSRDSLILVRKGGRSEQGTWLHEDLAIEIAGWIKPKLRLWINRVAKKLMRDKVVYLENEIEGLKAALSESQAWVEVREHQLEEAIAESQYHRLELEARLNGYHPDLEEIGQFKGGIYD